jgi:hypothetical protein
MSKAIAFRSKKAKGKRLEHKIASLIRQKGLDEGARAMIGSGAFDDYKGDIYAPKVPLIFEAKNQEKVQLWQFWEQAKAQERVYKPACLVVSGNYRPMLAVVELETLLNLLLEIKQLSEQELQDK